MSGTPFDSVTPIGRPKAPPNPRTTISQSELRRRTERTRANRSSGHPAQQSSEKPRKRLNMKEVHVAEAIEKTSAMLRMFFEEATDEASKAADRKHYSVAYGVMIDKLNVLKGRPTEIIGVIESEQQRPAIRNLGLRLARAQATAVRPEGA